MGRFWQSSKFLCFNLVLLLLLLLLLLQTYSVYFLKSQVSEELEIKSKESISHSTARFTHTHAHTYIHVHTYAPMHPNRRFRHWALSELILTKLFTMLCKIEYEWINQR